MLRAEPRVQLAAQIGHEFKLDPVAVLEEVDEFRVAVRIAALLYNAKERERAAKAAQKKR